jgi:hypothetical protein
MLVKTMVIFAFLFMIAPSLMAKEGDHLVPEAAYLTNVDEYSFALKKLFSAGFDRDVVLTIMAFPSFGVESLVGIRKSEGGTYSVFLLIPEASIRNRFYDSMGHPISADLKSIPVKNVSRRMPDNLAKGIIELIRGEVLRAKFDLEVPPAVDGARYSFSINIRPHFMTGARLISFSEKSRMNKLASLSDSLVDYAQGLKNEENINGYLKVLSR